MDEKEGSAKWLYSLQTYVRRTFLCGDEQKSKSPVGVPLWRDLLIQQLSTESACTSPGETNLCAVLIILFCFSNATGRPDGILSFRPVLLFATNP
jgi:hypothetical protein